MHTIIESLFLFSVTLTDMTMTRFQPFYLQFKHVKCAVHFPVFIKRCNHIQSVKRKHHHVSGRVKLHVRIRLFSCLNACKEDDFMSCLYCLINQKTAKLQHVVWCFLLFTVNPLQCRDRKERAAQVILNYKDCNKLLYLHSVFETNQNSSLWTYGKKWEASVLQCCLDASGHEDLHF